MKQQEIIEIVEERFKDINKLYRKILKKFDEEDIHNFRVEVKKLRAFLRLLDIKKDGPIIPKLLKIFYGHVGVIRNIQLYEQSFLKYITSHGFIKPDGYIKLLKNEKDYQEKETRHLIKSNNFLKVKETALKNLPAKLEKPGIKKFVQNKLDDLKLQLEYLNDDIPLHNIRKILKDILYTCDYIKHYANLPAAISNKKALKSLTAILGEFIDKFIQLEFLKPAYLDKINDEDQKNVLSKIRISWLRKKRAIKQKLQLQLIILRQQVNDFELSSNE